MGDPYFGVRLDAVSYLSEMKDKNLYPLFIKALCDDEPNIRTSAAHALAMIGDAKAIPEIKKLLNAKEPLVVLGATDALWRLNDKSGLWALRKKLIEDWFFKSGYKSDMKEMIRRMENNKDYKEKEKSKYYYESSLYERLAGSGP